MQSAEHKAEAERLLTLARTGKGAQEDDPVDPMLVLQLSQTHALLAAVPDELIAADVVDEEAEALAHEARALAASFRLAGERPAFVELLERLARALEERS